MRTPNPSLSPNKYNGHPTLAIHHTTLIALSLTFILSLLVLVLSAKYAEFVIQSPPFSHKSLLALVLYAALTPLVSLLATLTLLLLPERSISLPPTILLLAATLLALGWTGTTYLWTSCELVLPVRLSARGTIGPLPSFCPMRDVQSAMNSRDSSLAGVIMWTGLVRTRSVVGWMCVVTWGVIAWAGWKGWKWERGTSEREERGRGWVAPGGEYELEIRHWDQRADRYSRLDG